MIKETGGKVVRQDEGHHPDGASTHHGPHINYRTKDNKRATVIVKEE
jgi:hypothetical protein